MELDQMYAWIGFGKAAHFLGRTIDRAIVTHHYLEILQGACLQIPQQAAYHPFFIETGNQYADQGLAHLCRSASLCLGFLVGGLIRW
jgi:hypothetical protein